MNSFKVFRDKKWLLVFRQKYESAEDLFKNESEVLFSNAEKKFSILGNIDKSFRIRNKYEFLLEYPGNDGFNHWTQTKNPVFAEPEKENGYKPIATSWTGCSWHGLSRSSETNRTFIDGSPFHGNWFYSIGAYITYYNSIPGFRGIDSLSGSERDEAKIYEVLLWIRIAGGECSFQMKRRFNTYLFCILCFYS